MSARFKTGDCVIVRTDNPAGHVRTPTYLRGKRGVILREFGPWPNPEQLAYGKPGWPRKTNYWVQFAMDEVWGGSGAYAKSDTVVAEIYEHWLEPDMGPRSAS
jgi:nitrile hydratase subunit beta